MKNLLALPFILIMLFSVASDLFVYFSFKINQDYIIEVLCENNDQPELECEGQCFLDKQLKEKRESIPPFMVDKQMDLTFTIEEIGNQLHEPFLFCTENISTHLNKTLNAHLSDIFHPPQCL